MTHLRFHPAPGLGDLMPGFFVVPNNPILDASRGASHEPTVSAYIPHFGELVPARFAVPENPLLRAMRAQNPLYPGTASSGGLGGCECVAGMCGCGAGLPGMSGLGVLGLDPTISTALLGVGGLLLVSMLMSPGGKEYKQRKRKLEVEHRTKLAQLKSSQRGYRRIARGAAGAARRGFQTVEEAV